MAEKRPPTTVNRGQGAKTGNYFETMDKSEKRIEAKGTIDETIRTIELDGFKSFFSATTFCGKMFWLSLLVFSLSILIYQLVNTISDYINSPTISTFTIKTNDTLDFPTLYLCPASLVSQVYLNRTPSGESQAIAYKEEMAAVWDYTEYLATGNLSAEFESNHEKTLKDIHAKHDYDTSMDSVDLQDFWLNATVPLNMHLRHCEFRSFVFLPLNCSDITREVLDPEYGKCYAMDLGNLHQTVEGQGLQFVFNVQSKTYPTASNLAPIFNGVYVSIIKEFNPSAGDSILLTPNTYTRVDLAAQHQVFMHQPNQGQPCVKTVDIVNDDDDGDDGDSDAPSFEFKVFNANYSQSSCKYDCVAREFAAICNCLPPTDRSLYIQSAFNVTEGFCRYKHLQCIKEKVHGNSTVTDRISSCRDQCFVPCKDWRYDVRTTSMNLYQAGFDPKEPVQDIIYVTVAYSHMEYSKYTQADSMEPDDLVANLGGQIGLWLGGSMMTLIQIPLFLFAFCSVSVFHKTKNVAAKRGQSVQPTK